MNNFFSIKEKLKQHFTKIVSGLSMIIIGSATADAQASLYNFTQSNGTFTPITGNVLGVATGNAAATNLNSEVYPLTLPFGFIFNGNSYTSANVSSNGFLTFGSTAPAALYTTPITGATAYEGAISPFGRDICSVYDINGVTGNISWDVVGTAPNREIIIQWKDFRPTSTLSLTDVYTFSFQLRLQETSNVIKMVYTNGSYLMGNAAYSSTASIGLRGSINTDFKTRTNGTTLEFVNSTAGTANSNVQSCNTVNAVPGMPSAGLTYTWTPPACWSPQGLTFVSSTTNSANISWNTPVSSGVGNDIYYSTSTVAPTASTPPTLSNLPGTAATLSPLTPATNYYVWIRSNCGSGNTSVWVPQFLHVSTPCQPSSVTATNPAAVCPNMPSTLSATVGAGAVCNWYSSSTGGTPLATGTSYTTPPLTSTTNYWVAAAKNTVGYVGMTAPVSTVGNAVVNSIGIVFDALKPMTIETVDIYPISPTSTTGTVTIDLKDAANTTLSSTTANVVVNPTGAMNAVPLNFQVPAGTGYKLVVTGKSASISSFLRESNASYFSFPYILSGVCSITESTAPGFYYYLYNLKIASLCESPLQQVTAAVDSACLSTSETDKKNAIKVYPNPFSDVINISKPELVKTGQVLDISGKVVRTFSQPESSLRLNDLSAGIYILQMEMKDGSSQTTKIIKK